MSPACTHTPEPWIVEPINNGETFQIVTENDPLIVIAETETGHQIDKLNADLMAASPNMLAALRLAEAFVAEELGVRILSAGPTPTEVELGDIEDARTVAKAIETAIGKAEGRGAHADYMSDAELDEQKRAAMAWGCSSTGGTA